MRKNVPLKNVELKKISQKLGTLTGPFLMYISTKTLRLRLRITLKKSLKERKIKLGGNF